MFLDWLHDKVGNTWNLGLKDLHDQCPFDGLWLDMNEPSTFVDGEVDPATLTEKLTNTQEE